MLTFDAEELRGIATKLNALSVEMRTFAGSNAMAPDALKVSPGGGAFTPAAGLKKEIENFASTFGTQYTWLLGVIEQLRADTDATQKTMENSEALASTAVTQFRDDFSGTLAVMTPTPLKQTGVSP